MTSGVIDLDDAIPGAGRSVSDGQAAAPDPMLEDVTVRAGAEPDRGRVDGVVVIRFEVVR